MNPGFVAVVVVLFFIIANTVKILREYERAVVFRLGRFVGVRGPGEQLRGRGPFEDAATVHDRDAVA